MDEITLKAEGALDGLHSEIGDMLLVDAGPRAIASVAPFRGRSMAVGESLSGLVNVGLPTVGHVAEFDGGKVLWSGLGQWLVCGDFEAYGLMNALAKNAAVTDQGDAWAVFTLTGSSAEPVMSRLCSLDLRNFKVGQTARAEYAHMMSVISPIKNGFEIMVLRSFAKTAIHETKKAMRSVAAIQEL